MNLRGEVVGINTVINVGPGGSYGFAIPIRQVSDVANTIVKEGRVRYPYLGVMIANLEELPPEARTPEQAGPSAGRSPVPNALSDGQS